MLKGKKVVLRPLKKSDIGFFLKWYNDPEVIQYLTMYLPMTELSEEKWINESMERQRAIFVIEAILKNGHLKPIGSCGIHSVREKDRVGTFGIAIGEKKFWSDGYGTDAARTIIDYGFRFLNLHKIESGAMAFNERSVRMHLRVGFKKEGRRRQSWHRDGRYVDEFLFGLLRREWEKKRK